MATLPQPHEPLFQLARHEPRNASQKLASKLYAEKDLVFLLGPAGSGKSFSALYLALQDLCNRRRKKLLVIRPPVECGPSLGFLPGELQEKVAPWARIMEDLLHKMVHKGKLPSGSYEFAVPNHLRGSTWDDMVVVIDEAQNIALPQLRMLLSRIGQNCKVIVCGDADQADIPSRFKEYDADIAYVVDQLEGLPSVGIVDFTAEECLRNPLVSLITQRLRN